MIRKFGDLEDYIFSTDDDNANIDFMKNALCLEIEYNVEQLQTNDRIISAFYDTFYDPEGMMNEYIDRLTNIYIAVKNLRFNSKIEDYIDAVNEYETITTDISKICKFEFGATEFVDIIYQIENADEYLDYNPQ